MSNIILILANYYEKYNQDKMKKKVETSITKRKNKYRLFFDELHEFAKNNFLQTCSLLIMIVSLIWAVIFSIYDNKQMYLIMFAIYGVGIVMFAFSEHLYSVKYCNSDHVKYKKDMKNFKEILNNEFNIKSKEQMDYIVQLCDKCVEDENMLKKFYKLWKDTLFPFITFAFGSCISFFKANNINDIKFILGILLMIIGVYFMLVGLIIIFQNAIYPIFKLPKYRIKRLRKIVIDINITYYKGQA